MSVSFGEYVNPIEAVTQIIMLRKTGEITLQVLNGRFVSGSWEDFSIPKREKRKKKKKAKKK